MSDVLFQIGDRNYDTDSARAKIENQDQHIGNLEQENQELRQQVEKHMEALAGITTKGNNEEPTEPPAQNPSVVSAEDIARIVQEQLSALNQKSTVQKNASLVESSLTEKFGTQEAAASALQDKAKELGLSGTTVDKLVEESPAVILGWFGETSSNNMPSMPSTSRNTLAMQSSQTAVEKGSWAWWQNVKADDPKFYSSPKAYRQRMSDAERLGREKFFGK